MSLINEDVFLKKRRVKKEATSISNSFFETKPEAHMSLIKEDVEIEERSVDYSNEDKLLAQTLTTGIFLVAYDRVYCDKMTSLQLTILRNLDLYKIAKESINKWNETYSVFRKLLSDCVFIIDNTENINEAIREYRRAYMRAFSKEERQKGGKVYTGHEIVTWIHDKLEEQSPLDLNKTYWDPACGTGHFPLDWYERLMNHWKENHDKYLNKLGIDTEQEAHRWIVEKCLYFSDIDPFAIRLIRLALYLKYPEVTNLQYNSFEGDSLLDEPFGDRKFDYIAGNPPYTLICKTNKKSNVYKKYLTCKSRSARLSGLFVELAIRRSCIVGLITDDTTLLGDSIYSSFVRNQFEHAEVEYAMSKDIFIKTGSAGTRAISFIVGEYVKKDKVNDIIVSNWYDFIYVQRFGNQQESLPIIKKIDNIGKNWNFTITNGVETGDNSKFIKKTVPPSSFLKVITPKCVEKYFISDKCEYLDLSSRLDIKGQTKLKEWEEVESEYICAKYNVGSIHDIKFSLVSIDGFIGLHHSIFMLRTNRIKALLSILNSKVSKYYLFHKGGAQQGNSRRLTIGLYRTFPLPILIEQIEFQLNDLTDKMLQNPNDQETQAEIDKIVYELYDLTDNEIKTIEEALK